MVYWHRAKAGVIATTAGLIIAGFLTFFPSFSTAQSFYGSVVGTVTDSTGAIIPGASVALTNTGTSERHDVLTDSKGNYQFVNLIPGTYRIEIEAPGFKRLSRDGIQVQVQAAVRIDATMQLGQVTDTIEVTAQTPLLQTEQASLSQVVEGRTVQEIPLNGRNVLNLVSMVPGVVAQNGTSGNPMNNLGTVTQPTAWAAYQIGGGQSNQSAAFYDGVPVNNSFVNSVVLVPTQDAVQEFRVASNSVSPEFGRFAGGVVNFTSKSGTNQFHGNVYEYFRNTVLNANTFFNNKNGVGRPAFNQNQFGANVTGPVIQDKTFFMFAYEGFKQRIGSPLLTSVPTAAMREGDFSAPGLPKIYDPLTVCGFYGNPPCATDPKGNPIYVRQQFKDNKIPVNRIDPTAKYMLYYWALPNLPGTQNNYAANGTGGGDQYQINARMDHAISDKQRLFGRFTRWVGSSIPNDPFQNLVSATTFSFLNNSFVIGDTYAISSTSILDMRFSYMHFNFGSFQLDEPHDMCEYGPNYCKLNDQLTFKEMIGVNIPGVRSVGEWANRDGSDNETWSAGFTKIMGRHTLKFGGESRFIAWRHTVLTPPSGEFRFTNGWTAQNALSTAGSGQAFASFLLGFMDSGTAAVVNIPNARQWYHGLYISDVFQAGKRLTLNLGLRWEYPGSFYERDDSTTVLLPDATNPLAQEVGLPLKGNIALVNSQDYPDRKMSPAKWKLFGPRVGLAYRLNDKTVVRAGYGLSYLSNDSVITNSPWATAPNKAITTVTTSLDGNITPYSTMVDPFPNGLIQPPGHSSTLPDTLYGTNVVSPVPDGPYPYMQQWNLAVQRELMGGLALEICYAGSKGTHMPLEPLVSLNNPTYEMNQIPDQYLSMGTALLTQVPNPFYGKVPASAGILAQPTIAQGQLLRPMPQYLSVNNTANMGGYNSYNSLQAKLERRFGSGGSLLATYAWSKNIGTSDSLTSWTENPDYGGSIQDWNNHKLDKSLLNYDVPHNFSLSYVLDLPFGRGRKFGNGLSGAADKLLSGWSISGSSTIRNGYPLHLTAQPTTLSRNFGGGTPRPNVVVGCDKAISGSAQSRLSGWFNKACFSQPGPFAFGDESRSDPELRSHGVNNFDVSVYKNTAITEQVKLRFQVEFYNIANRVQFSPPNVQLGNPNFGNVTSIRNQPRLVQFALRLTF